MRILILLLFCLQAMAVEPPRPKITGAAHVALFVADVEKSRAFYKDLLGYGEPFDLKTPSGELSLTFIKINERQYLEIFPEKEKDSDRLNHVSVETDDIEGMRTYLGAKGVKVPEKLSNNRIGNRSFNVKDPDGHTLEFVQYLAGGASVREKGKFLGAQRISTRMAHFGILVGNLEASQKFYHDILGFQEFWRGSRDGKILNWVNMKVPDGDDYIELMLYDGAQPEPTKRGTAHHICLFVPDIEKAKADLQSRPASKGYSKPMEIRTGTNRKRQMNLYDPDGTRVELMEPHTMDGKPTPPSTAPPPSVNK